MNKKNIKTFDALVENNLINPAQKPLLEKVVSTFSVAITNQMHQLIDKSNPNDPIAKQFVPSIEELDIATNELADPIGDNKHQSVKGIIHRYPDRCLFTPVLKCPIYCRFCFRREKIGNTSETLTPTEIDAAFAYIEKHKEIWEVILTGGDPLILKPALLKKFIDRLNAIDHVAVLRIHTRVPVVDSARINPEMILALKCEKPIYIILHANHPTEFTKEAIEACKALIDAGIPMLSQTVLLKNLNDNIEVLSELMRSFVKYRIKPYYLHHCDLAKSVKHFRTTIETGQRLVKELRGRFSGLCQPTYVLDIPDGYGKIPIGPCYISLVKKLENGDKVYDVQDYNGLVHEYLSLD